MALNQKVGPRLECRNEKHRDRKKCRNEENTGMRKVRKPSKRKELKTFGV
jgi:hypothetical protein